ncbi:helix-turn-helix domain-containing protein [Acaricomes phytoseiuli]|uniref:helix-turn-helix transcriptional regulator n=1 Tax=Acaricomes phytoseiuli TaxID=291968 RepID=UPI0005BD6BF3
MEVIAPEKIRRGRLQKGYSQRDLAHLVRRSQAAIQLLESGKMRTCTEALALSISNRLDIPWEDIFRAHERFQAPLMSTKLNIIEHVPSVGSSRKDVA